MTNQEAADELQYAIDLIKQDGKDWLDERDIPILEAAISALQAQEVKQEVKKSRCTYKPDCPWYDGSKCNSPNDHEYHECDYDRGIFPESYEENVKNSTESSLTQKGLDTISRQSAIDAISTMFAPTPTQKDMVEDCLEIIDNLPSAQPEYYDYSDIEPLWKSFAEENDINLTDTAKQLKDAMWCGYRKGKADAQSEPCEDADKLKRCKFEYINACKTVTYPTPDTNKSDIHDAYAVIKALNPIFGDEEF